MTRYLWLLIALILSSCTTIPSTQRVMSERASVAIAATLTVGSPELLYADAQMPFTMDGSFATLRRDATTSFFWHADFSQDAAYSRWYGPLNNPLRTLVPGWPKTQAQMWNMQNLPGRPWLYNIYRVTANVLLGFLHMEATGGIGPPYAIGLGYSTDNGETWLYLGPIVKTQAQPSDWPFTATNIGNIGGAPYLVVGSYFYVYYNEWTRALRAGDVVGDKWVGVARALVTDVLQAAASGTVVPWTKYSAMAGWVEHGLTGLGSNIIPDANGSTNSDVHTDAAFSPALNKYLLLWDNQALGDLFLYQSDDGVTWGSRVVVDAQHDGSTYMGYPAFVDQSGISEDSHVVGSDFYVIYPRKTTANYSIDQLYRVHMTVSGLTR